MLTTCMAAFGWTGRTGMLVALIAGLATGLLLELLMFLLRDL